MKKILLVLLSFLLITCDNSVSSNDSENSSWVFIANEGGFNSSNGTVSMIDQFDNIIETEILGDVVQSVKVYNDKLIVLINNNQKIIYFDINSDGINNQQELIINDSPREMEIINNKGYISTWDPDWLVYGTTPGNVIVLNLETYEIENSIEVGIMPEGLLYSQGFLWVANSGDSTLSKIDINNNIVVENIEIGRGPQNLIEHESKIYVSRTFYDNEYDENGYWINTVTTHGSSKIDNDQVIINNYGNGVVCGGSVLSYNNNVYRSFSGGISPLNEDLSLDESARIGSYNQNEVYHVEIINDNVWFSIIPLDDYGYPSNEISEVKVLDSNGDEISNYTVGINPGDFTYWVSN